MISGLNERFCKKYRLRSACAIRAGWPESILFAKSHFSACRPIFFPRIDDSHCDRIHFSLTAVRCFYDGCVGKAASGLGRILCGVLVKRTPGKHGPVHWPPHYSWNTVENGFKHHSIDQPAQFAHAHLYRNFATVHLCIYLSIYLFSYSFISFHFKGLLDPVEC